MCSDRKAIQVEEASTHNLKALSCGFPHGALTVVTGVSGSGKSSLAFDTVYAEGQRRYVETLSTYARQFLDQMSRPPVKAVRNMPPALALKQGNGITNARSTVATVTELGDLFRVLFAGAGETWCRSCGAHVEKYSVGRVCEVLNASHEGERVVVMGTIRPHEGEDMSALLRGLVGEGYRRMEVDGALVAIDSVEALDALDRDAVRVVIDRVKVESESRRLAESIEKAFAFGECVAEVIRWDEPGRPELRFFDQLRCAACGTSHLPPVPALFDRSSAVGACQACGGYGRTVGIDTAKVVPDPRLSIRAGAVAPFQTPSMRRHQKALEAACASEGIPTGVPWRTLDAADRRRILGRGFAGFQGVAGFFADLHDDRYKPHIRVLIARYRGYADCEDCDGTGMSDEARAVRVDGHDLGALERLRVEELFEWVRNLALPDEVAEAIEPLLREITGRLEFLEDAGVGYLTLERQARTLSGGEMHRVLLATSVGRMLTDTCYVLDEPTAGLHAHDTDRLMGLVTRLRDIGNTVIVVEHDPAVMALAEHVVELGPRGGDAGGQRLFEGSYEALRQSETPTGVALRARTSPAARGARATEFLTVSGACLHNLDDVAASFPVGRMSVVTGVSGSGKSTLVHDVLYQKLMEARGQRSSVPLDTVRIGGGDRFAEVVLVDQASIPRSTRSCPLTFSGAYTPIRELFAATPYSRLNGLAAGAFSFNTKAGRCERCEGTGVRTIEMHFMADVDLVCDVCEGRRFQDEVLAARVNDLSISDVFNLTVDQALDVFADERRVVSALSPLARVGLGYVKLGQSTAQLSGGELQRLKLASYIGKSASSGERLFIFDEPTVGLHLYDVRTLVAALRELVDEGHTVIVVEHNLDFVAECDWVVDLGPGAGPAGGQLVFEGPVVDLPDAEGTLTGTHLRRAMQAEAGG